MSQNWLREISKTYSQLNEAFLPTEILNTVSRTLNLANNNPQIATGRYDGSFGGAGTTDTRYRHGNTKPGSVAIRQRAKAEGITPEEAGAASDRELLAARGDGGFGGRQGPAQREVSGNGNLPSVERVVTTPEGKKLTILAATPANRTGQFGGRNFKGSRTVAGNAPLTNPATNTPAARQAARDAEIRRMGDKYLTSSQKAKKYAARQPPQTPQTRNQRMATLAAMSPEERLAKIKSLNQQGRQIAAPPPNTNLRPRFGHLVSDGPGFGR